MSGRPWLPWQASRPLNPRMSAVDDTWWSSRPRLSAVDVSLIGSAAGRLPGADTPRRAHCQGDTGPAALGAVHCPGHGHPGRLCGHRSAAEFAPPDRRSAPTTVTVSSADDLRALIREVADFPKPGIRFYDITTLLKEGDAFREVIDRMAEQIGDAQVDVVVGMESRGFIFSAPLAYKLGAGFVPVRKLGKLPAETIEVEYELEYGTATLEIHSDAITKGQQVLIVDDLLATGGTVLGTIELVRRLGGEIAGLSFMVELTGLHGRDKLDEFDIHALISY
jgi:adenine phosphoribosyltransferase